MSVERSDSLATSESPWPGLSSFTEETRGFFFGREKETDELSRLVRRETLTVLFGQSGLGKSSLLQAGLFPVLRENDHLPLYLRLDHELSESADPTADLSRRSHAHAGDTPPLAEQVKQALNAAFAAAKADAPPFGPDETLWEYFHRKDVDIWSAKNRLLTPVLAFDQFEEIFTLGRADERRRERSRAFLGELADLVENRPPTALRDRFDRGEADPANYNFNKPSCRVILSLREDFLPDLEGLKQSLPALVHNRLRLKRLNGAQALEAVARPAPHLLAEGVGEKIVEFVAGARGGSSERLLEMEVEPALLSVICRELNERRRALGQDTITADLVSGNRREILTEFYERSVADLPEAMRTFVEDRLLTKSGFRDNLALETALEFPGVTRPLIDTLVARRLLRIEERMGVQRVELTHDVLAEVIRASRDTHQQRLALAAAARRTRRLRWAVAGLAVAVVGLTIGAFFGVRTQRQTTRRAAHTDFLLGSRMIDEGKFSDGLAYLVRAGRKDPSSHVIGPRILSSLAARNFALPDAKPLTLPSPPTSVEYTADGKRVFVQSEDGIVRIIDSATWSIEREFRFNPKVRLDGVKLAEENNSVFAVGLEDGSYVVADAVTGQPRGERIRPKGESFARLPNFALSSDGRWLATGTNADLSLWDAISGKLQTTLPVPAFPGSYVFSSDSRQIVTRRIRSVQRWSVPEGTPIGDALDGPESGTSWLGGPPFQMRIGARGSQLLFWNRNWVLSYDVKTGLPVRPPYRRTRGDIDLAWLNSDGTRLIFTGVDYSANVVDLATGSELHSPLKHGGPIEAAKVVAAGDVLFTNSVDGLFRLWDVNTGKLVVEPSFRQDRFAPAACSPDGKTLSLFPDSKNALRLRVGAGAAAPWIIPRDFQVIPLWQWMAGPPARALMVMSDQARAIDIATGNKGEGSFTFPRRILSVVGRSIRLPSQGFAAGETFVVASREENQAPRFHAWTLGKGRVDREIPLMDIPAGINVGDGGAFNVSEDGRYFVNSASSDRRTLGIWDLQSGRRHATLPVEAPLLTGRAFAMFSPDGTRLAFRTADRLIHVWDVPAGKKLCTIKLTGRASVSMSIFSADSQRLLTGDDWGRVLVWEAATGRLLRTTQAHRGVVMRMETYSANGRYYISGSSDGTVQVWDGNTDTIASPLLADSGGGSVSFSPDISRISTGSNEGALRVWDVRTGLALSDPMRHEGEAVSIRAGSTYYSRDGKFVALRFEKAIGFWSAPPEDRGAGVPDWLLRLATVCGAQRLEDDGQFVSAADEVARTDELRREIARLPADAPYVAWARWLLDDSPTRSIGPAFTITPAEARKLAEEMTREQAALAAAAKAVP